MRGFICFLGRDSMKHLLCHMLLSAHGRSFACAEVFFSSYRQSSILAMCILDRQGTSTRHDAAAVAHRAVCIRCCLKGAAKSRSFTCRSFWWSRDEWTPCKAQ